MLFIVVLMRFFNLVISIFNAINLSSISAKVNEFEKFDEATTNETTTNETTTDETTTDETTTDETTTNETTTDEAN
jgi:cytoskeletal protein RodZ